MTDGTLELEVCEEIDLTSNAEAGQIRPRSEHFALIALSAIIFCLTVISGIGLGDNSMQIPDHTFFSSVALFFLLIPIGIPAVIALLLYSWRHKDRLLRQMSLLTLCFNTAQMAAFVMLSPSDSPITFDPGYASLVFPLFPLTLTVLLIRILIRAKPSVGLARTGDD